MYHYTVTCARSLGIGNIANITDIQGGSQVQNFTYDTLDRLLSANAVGGYGGLYSESYTYDPNTGNLSSKAGVNYTYSPTKVHAVTSLSNGNSYAYDANGNMTSRTVGGVTYTLTYDAENRLVTLSGGGVMASYVFDGDGNRVKTVVNGTTVTYIGNYFEWSNNVGTKYYYSGSVRVGTALNYLFSDHLGSTSITADSAGNLAGGMRYTAWGETRYTAGSTPTNFRYTGQRQAEAGLYYYVARFYDPALGRFNQADTMVPKPGSPLAWDRYAYSNNNPINFIDPSGHKACELECPGDNIDQVEAQYGKAWNGEWDVQEQKANQEKINTYLLGGVEAVLYTVAPPIGLLFAISRPDREVNGLDVALALIPAGGKYGDEIAEMFSQAGYGVNKEVVKRTPFDLRRIDIEVSSSLGEVLGGIKTKLGKSKYTSTQRAKDEWLGMIGYIVNLVRGP